MQKRLSFERKHNQDETLSLFNVKYPHDSFVLQVWASMFLKSRKVSQIMTKMYIIHLY